MSITGNSNNIFVNDANLKIAGTNKGLLFSDGSIMYTAPPNSDPNNTAYFSNAINAFVITESTANTGFAGNTNPQHAISVAGKVVIDKDGSIGVGTASPSANLHVVGNVVVGTNITVSNIFTSGNLSVNSIAMDLSKTSNVITYDPLTGELFDSGGEGGGGSNVEAGTAGQIAYYSTSTTVKGDGALTFDENNSNVDVSGNVNVSGNTHSNLVTSIVYFGSSPANPFTGGLTFSNVVDKGNTTSNTVQFTNTGTSLVTSGSVGIGTTSPSANLQVMGNCHIFQDYTIGSSDTVNLNPQLRIGNSTYENGNVYVGYSGRGNTGIVNAVTYWAGMGGSWGTAGYFGIAVNNQADANPYGITEGEVVSQTHFAIKDSGNVGIGTTSPSANLHVVGNVYANVASNTYGTLHLHEQDGGTKAKITNSNAYGTITLSNDPINDGTNDIGYNSIVFRMGDGMDWGYIQGETNGSYAVGTQIERSVLAFGVGNNGPAAGSNYQEFIQFRTPSTASMDIGQESNTMILYNGNVGVGPFDGVTTSPISKFDVVSGGAVSNGSRPRMHYNGTLHITPPNTYNGYYLNGPVISASRYLDTGALDYAAWSIDNEFSGTNPYTSMLFKTNDGTGNLTTSEKMRIHWNGNVGIGTTSPSEKLEVSGNVYVVGATSDVSLSARSIGESNDAIIYLGTPFNSVSATKCAIIAEGRDSWSRSNLHFCLNDVGFSNDPVYTANIATSRMTILSGGNVGISNTSPNHKLSVNGDVYASGSYLPFTGAHISLNTLSSYEDGTLVASTGNVSVDDTVYNTSVEIEPTSVSKDKRVIGITCKRETEISDGESNAEPNTYTITTTQIIALGEGRMLVCNENGDIENGDYICSSNVIGHGMKQDDDLLHNYTVAKATENCSFTGPDDKKLVSVTFHCG